MNWYPVFLRNNKFFKYDLNFISLPVAGVLIHYPKHRHQLPHSTEREERSLVQNNSFTNLNAFRLFSILPVSVIYVNIYGTCLFLGCKNSIH